MARLREHIHRLDFLRFVAAVFQDAEVAGECGRVAADVDEALRAVVEDRTKQVLVTAFPWRVDDEDVESLAFLVPARDDVFGRSGFEMGVREAVHLGIALGVFDCLRDDFDAVYFFRLFGEEERDRADAAVGVDDGFVAAEVGVVECL